MTVCSKNGSNRKLLTAFAVSSLVAGVVLVGAGQANAAEISSVAQPSHFSWLSSSSKAHQHHIKKVGFNFGNSSNYSRANLLPKTEHFVQPAVAINTIIANGGSVCSISGLGHRSACGAGL